MKSKRDASFSRPGAKLGAALADVGEKIVVFDDREKFERRGADQRAAAKSRPVQSRAESGGETFVGDERAEREAARQRLRDRHDVRQRLEFLVSELAAGAAEAALNFVGDQRGAVVEVSWRARFQKASDTS